MPGDSSYLLSESEQDAIADRVVAKLPKGRALDWTKIALAFIAAVGATASAWISTLNHQTVANVQTATQQIQDEQGSQKQAVEQLDKQQKVFHAEVKSAMGQK